MADGRYIDQLFLRKAVSRHIHHVHRMTSLVNNQATQTGQCGKHFGLSTPVTTLNCTDHWDVGSIPHIEYMSGTNIRPPTFFSSKSTAEHGYLDQLRHQDYIFSLIFSPWSSPGSSRSNTLRSLLSATTPQWFCPAVVPRLQRANSRTSDARLSHLSSIMGWNLDVGQFGD
jgi:hypothetical protein